MAVRILLSYVFLLLVLLIVAVKSFAVAKEDERPVIFRLGKLLGIHGPGLSLVLPFPDRVVRVKVEIDRRLAGLERE